MTSERRVSVEWVGGPFDEQRFKVIEGTRSVTVQREDDSKFELPIVRRAGRYYVVWAEERQ